MSQARAHFNTPTQCDLNLLNRSIGHGRHDRPAALVGVRMTDSSQALSTKVTSWQAAPRTAQIALGRVPAVSKKSSPDLVGDSL